MGNLNNHRCLYKDTNNPAAGTKPRVALLHVRNKRLVVENQGFRQDLYTIVQARK